MMKHLKKELLTAEIDHPFFLSYLQAPPYITNTFHHGGQITKNERKGKERKVYLTGYLKRYNFINFYAGKTKFTSSQERGETFHDETFHNSHLPSLNIQNYRIVNSYYLQERSELQQTTNTRSAAGFDKSSYNQRVDFRSFRCRR